MSVNRRWNGTLHRRPKGTPLIVVAAFRPPTVVTGLDDVAAYESAGRGALVSMSA
jgi:hypothetical protein